MKDYNKKNLKRLMALFATAIVLTVSLWSITDGNLFSRITAGVVAVSSAAFLFIRKYHDKG